MSPARRRLIVELARWHDSSGGGASLVRGVDANAGLDRNFIRMAQKNPAFAMRVADSLTKHDATDGNTSREGTNMESIRRGVLREWVKQDPTAALGYVTGKKSAWERSSDIRLLMQEWSKVDPSAAVAALATLPESGRAFTRNDYAETLLRGWHEQDAAAAQEWAKSQNDPALRERLTSLAAELAASSPAARTALLLEAPQRDLSRLTDAFSEWLAAEPDAAVAKLAAIPATDKFWEHEAENVAGRWAMHARSADSADDLQKVLESVPAGPQRDAFLEGFVNHGASNDIPFAQQMLSHMGEGRPRNEAMGTLTELWMRKDPVALSEWLSAQPQTDSRHYAVTRFAQLLAKSDPERAARWVDTVPDGFAFKESAVQTINQSWQAADPAAAAAWRAR